ncbi:ROK family transcriptional regulator [Cellulomonas sp. ATA003]|uniref:ROK family transcriptional regulator n=1 Tax=Cellulomonas sp. ATA003 TaxID=3073064 RepID=UPI002873A103|nr:ROK family transcriptional regulator [Cellulomonas sp. ATA003]WNB84698.1 ROK family transcriptional regulator [Cellulomonas sp. ATA003]
MSTTDTWGATGGSAHEVALEVLLHGPLSRAELARRLGLSQASLSRLTKPLLTSGLLIESPTRADPATGRPAQPLDVVQSSHHFVGVKLTGEVAAAVLVDLRGTVRRTAQAPVTDPAPDRVVAVLADLVASVTVGVRPTGIGIGLGGHAPDHRTVAVAPFLDWSGVPLADLLERTTGVPTTVENDVVALTAAEHWFGEGRGRRSLAVVTIGAGVGYGLVQHDQLVVHRDVGIGLVGHYPLSAHGAVCVEGHRGCATAMLTIPSLIGQASVALGRPVTYDELLDLARAGDRACARLVDDAARALGRLLAAVGNLTMPDRIVVTGEGVALAEMARAAVDAGIAGDRDPRASALDVVTRPGDFRQWARGAGVVAIQEFVLRTR